MAKKPKKKKGFLPCCPESDIKDCPFCGGSAKIITWGESHKYGGSFKSVTYSIRCEDCEAITGWDKILENAIEHWNQRWRR